MTRLVKILTRDSQRILAVNVCGTWASFTTSATSWQYNKMRYDRRYCRHKRKLENYRCMRTLEGLKPSERERLRKLQIEYEVMKAEGCTEVPDEIDAYEWCDILRARNEEERLSRYRYIKSDQIELRERKRLELEIEIELDTYPERLKESGHMENVFMHVDEACNKDRQFIQNITSDLFGYKHSRDIVIDFPKIDLIKKSETLNARMQIQNLKTILEMNQKHLQPSKFHVSNCGEMFERSQWRTDLNTLKEEFPCVTFHNGNILSEFKKDHLVYITPSTPWSSNVLEDNSNDIPVLILTNRQNSYNLIKSLADLHGIRHASFPLHKYVRFKDNELEGSLRHMFLVNMRFTDKGRFHFTVAESVGVIQDLYLHHDWTLAFTNNMIVHTSKYTTEAEFHLHNVEYRQQHKQKYKKNISTKVINRNVRLKEN